MKTKQSGNFRYKVIFSGENIEIYEYVHLVTVGSKVVVRKPRQAEKSELSKAVRLNRARNKVRRLINQNFTKNHYFLTLTFNNKDESLDKKNVKECNKKFSEYIRKVRRGKNDLKYLAVVQFQDTYGRGAVHYHLLLNKKPYKRFKSEIYYKWGNGSIKINKIQKVKNVGAYVTAYMSKELNDGRLDGLKSYFTSKNLQQPIEIFSNKVPQKILKLENKKPTYQSKYLTRYNGTVIYKSYSNF